MKRPKKSINYQQINRFLILFIVVCNSYVLLVPLWPKANLAIQKNITKPVKVKTNDEASLQAIDRSYNHVIMPDIQLDQRIYEGTSPYTVNKGVWHLPYTSTPDQPSNTVLVGHRFSYRNPAVFYNLDQLEVGQHIIVVWDNKLYIYTINESKVVNPTDVYVEDPTNTATLTMYTCTPLWSTRHRLVLTSNLERIVE